MNSKEQFNFTDIPKIFRSDATGGYFEHCISCDCNLQVEGKDYLIEKAFKSYNGLTSYATLFEYAMCWKCVEKMRLTLSMESRANMTAYFKKHSDLEKRRYLFEKEPKDIDRWLERCIVSDDKAEDLSEFQIYAHCHGKELIFHHYPFMISGEVLDQLAQLISNKTLDDLQNFTDQLMGGPPEFADLLKSGPRVIF